MFPLALASEFEVILLTMVAAMFRQRGRSRHPLHPNPTNLQRHQKRSFHCRQSRRRSRLMGSCESWL